MFSDSLPASPAYKQVTDVCVGGKGASAHLPSGDREGGGGMGVGGGQSGFSTVQKTGPSVSTPREKVDRT